MFADRKEAGRRLAVPLGKFRHCDPLILALPRDGVPVAFEIAQALGAPLDLLLVRKIGAPHQEELGIGAVVDGPETEAVIDDALLRLVAPPPGYVEAEVKRQREEIGRRRAAYLGGRPPLPRAGRMVIVVDDGIATGNTARAALRALRRDHPARLVLAAPVAAKEAAAALAEEADEVICLETPPNFRAVGAHYGDFTQTTDAEVIGLLAKARR